MDSQNLYLNTKPSKLFIKAAIPGGVSMLASSLYTVFDSVFVGKFLGTTAFAALGLAMPAVIINFALADLIGVGSSVPISILLGRKEDDKANNYFSCAVLLIFITGLLSGLAIYFIAPWFLKLMGAENELLSLGVKYLRVYAVFSPLITIMFAVDNFLRICGKIKTSMFLNVFMSLGTVLLEILFIIVLGWGIQGSALGACVAMLVCVVTAMSFFVTGRQQLKFVRPVFSLNMIGEIIRNGMSTFLTNISGRVFSVVMNIMLLRLGGEAAVAVYGVDMTVCCIIEQLLYGIIDSLQPSVGYNYGAGRPDRIKVLEKYILSVTATISIGGGIIIFAFPQYLSVPFLQDTSLTGLAVTSLRITSFTYLVKWLSQSLQGLFMALERPLPAMTISVCSASIFPLIFIVLLYPMGLNGLWLNYTAASFLTTILASALFIRLRKKLFLPPGTR